LYGSAASRSLSPKKLGEQKLGIRWRAITRRRLGKPVEAMIPDGCNSETRELLTSLGALADALTV